MRRLAHSSRESERPNLGEIARRTQLGRTFIDVKGKLDKAHESLGALFTKQEIAAYEFGINVANDVYNGNADAEIPGLTRPQIIELMEAKVPLIEQKRRWDIVNSFAASHFQGVMPETLTKISSAEVEFLFPKSIN